ncbi:MAG TPA: hypothetical protein VL738_12455 [Dactylosporangium sp.]|jgi:hypothetical protein|nr:hypothetical protein [Dactylosporangium sp.]
MTERDLARELVRRAYAAEPFDADAGLAEVIRRAGRPPVDDVAVAGPHPVDVRRRRGLSVLAVFAGVVAMVLAVGLSLGRFAFGPATSPTPAVSPPQSGFPSAETPGPSALPVETEEPTPSDLPSSCAGAWKLTYAGGQFSVGDRGSACPALRRDRLLLMEDVSGNGLIGPGAAKVWPLQDVPDSLTPPFAFRVAGIPATTPGHTYELIHVRAADAGKATAGADAYEFYKNSMTISLTLVA